MKNNLNYRKNISLIRMECKILKDSDVTWRFGHHNYMYASVLKYQELFQLFRYFNTRPCKEIWCQNLYSIKTVPVTLEETSDQQVIDDSSFNGGRKKVAPTSSQCCNIFFGFSGPSGINDSNTLSVDNGLPLKSGVRGFERFLHSK